jgi:hypothetical protein
MFVIYNPVTKLYWNNENGWVDKDSQYTLFTEDETTKLSLPDKGRWLPVDHKFIYVVFEEELSETFHFRGVFDSEQKAKDYCQDKYEYHYEEHVLNAPEVL